MEKSFIELILGNLDEKREWRLMMKRVNALPKDYRFAYQKILHYFYQFGFSIPMSGFLSVNYYKKGGLEWQNSEKCWAICSQRNVYL